MDTTGGTDIAFDCIEVHSRLVNVVMDVLLQLLLSLLTLLLLLQLMSVLLVVTRGCVSVA